ncbi:S9 family peptidase [Ferrimonas sp. SCSIO 43195]|uniref:alpha/beta hydrolase family protein n=1 Tax=Ferrimonas sp. SCSIO 43195 TaxID=2822844 RepID=UPI002074B8DB|nr:S9 family peptidase [Ferrimonas sp. SCSIO 43195]USD38447.1 S9 family peptidase [Ferrimonas sp. SCSIO 43195]
MSRMILTLLLTLSLPLAAQIPVEDFAKSSQAYSVKLSPKGDRLALMTKVDGKRRVVILETQTRKPLHSIYFPMRAEVGSYYWASNDRIVVTKQYLKGWTEAPQYHGEMMAVDYDGDKPEYLFGYKQTKNTTGSRLSSAAGAIRAWGFMIDPLPEDEDHVLISSVPMGAKQDKKATVFRVNIHNGKRKKIAYAPVSFAQFLTDARGEVRFVTGTDKHGEGQIYYRNKRGESWTLFGSNNHGRGSVNPVAFASDHEVYVLDNTDASIQGLKKLDLTKGTSTLIYRDDTVDPSQPWLSVADRALYALELESSYPSYVFIDKQRPESRRLKGLLAAFPGQQVSLTSQTLDGKLAIVAAYSDTHPISYYLFDTEKNSVSLLLNSRGWVDPKQSATVQAISFTARDGMTIHGYLTVPAGTEAKNLPLLVNPHGGPHGVRDYWSYNWESQLFASRGMAVLQVNFRGSGGYGLDYEVAGYRNWGSKIQYDIIDATQHLIDTGVANKDNVCIYGGSFGGYSALQTPILAPDLFQCAIGFAGVYDLELMYEVGDIPDYQFGVNYLREVIGADSDNMKAFSPVYNADKLKVPLLLIHGGDDERVPIEHAEELREALDKHHRAYQWLELDKEGHGLFNEENRISTYKTMLSFLDQHLAL